MKRKKNIKKHLSSKKKSAALNPPDGFMALDPEVHHLKKTIQTMTESIEKAEERLQDMEIHVNLLTRLLTTLCIEKFGMRVGVLKRLIKRIEKEAIRDSQINHLEELYQLPIQPEKKGSNPQLPSKNDPWEEIS